MPKEAVLSPTGFNDDYSRGLRTEVHWGRDKEYVQVATLADESPHEFEGDAMQGWYCDLDRKGINDLIRNLRKARDQAFGRDE